MSGDCRVCRNQPASTDGLCKWCHQDRERDRAQDREVDPVPDSEQDVDVNYLVEPNQENGRGLSLGDTCGSEEFAELRAAYHAGTLKPEPRRLGAIPSHFGSEARAICADMELLAGLRLAEGEDRPLPYPASEPVAMGFVRDKRKASRHLRRLVNVGVWVDADPLKPFKVAVPGSGQQLLPGTKCYVPGGEG